MASEMCRCLSGVVRSFRIGTTRKSKQAIDWMEQSLFGTSEEAPIGRYSAGFCESTFIFPTKTAISRASFSSLASTLRPYLRGDERTMCWIRKSFLFANFVVLRQLVMAMCGNCQGARHSKTQVMIQASARNAPQDNKRLTSL